MKTESVSNGSAPPKKLFYRINEVARMTGLKPYVLRYWESEFPELAPEKDASSQRRYRARDIEIVRAIRKLLYEDRFTIQGARRRLKDELRQAGAPRQSSQTEPAPPEAREAAEPEFPFDRPSALPREAPAAPSGSERAVPPGHGQPALDRVGQGLFLLRSEVQDLIRLLEA